MSEHGTGERDRRPEPAARRAGILLALALSAFAALAGRRGHPGRMAAFAAAAATVAALGWLAPRAWAAVFRAWMRVGRAVAGAVTRLVLVACFYLVVTPLGRLRRLTGRPPLDVSWKDGRTSYWRPKPVGRPAAESCRKSY